MSIIKNKTTSTVIFIVGIILFCAFCLGVSSFAADTGISSSLGDGDDRTDDHSSSGASTATDLLEGLSNEVSNLDTPVILLQSGTVVVANDIESIQTLGATASQNDPVGYSIEVSSSIGSLLFVPSDYSEGSFAVDSSGYLIGIRSSTIQCYIGDYTVRFPSYGQPQYRLTNGSSYSWTDINISYESSSNVEIVGYRINWWDDKFRTLLAVAGLFFLLILAYRRHE